jgi:ABC-2 type transport system ATP-binding protein
LYKKNGLLDTIIYFATLRGVPADAAKKKGIEWLERFNLQTYAKRKIEELSKGNQQKAQFITTILHNPELIILDEPFSGLDPVNQIVMKEVFQDLKQQGKAVIFSTHQMETAEKLCDEICLINRGRIVLEGTLKQVKQKFGTNSLHLEYEGDGKFLSSLPFVKKSVIYENYAELGLNGDVSSKEILSAITPKLELRKFEFVEPSLNSIFLNVVGVTVEQIENDKSDEKQPVVIPSIKNPDVKKQQILIILGTLMIFVGIVFGIKNQNMWGLAGGGLIISIVSFMRLQKAKRQLKKESAGE